MAAFLAAALWRGDNAREKLLAVAAAAFWLGVEWLAADPRLLFPFAMGCAGAAVWRWSWAGGAAGGTAFLLLRMAAGAPPGILQTEALGTALCLAAAGVARRAGPAAAASAASLAGLAGLLL